VDLPPLLYIHPRGHLNDLVIPAGALACMNGVRIPKLGRYSFEVTPEEIRAARVVALDLHWALALPGVETLLAHVRRLNPAARVIAGGITAGHFAEELVERMGIDFVIRGDSETAFAALVMDLLEGREVDAVPNVFVRGRAPAAPRRMTSQEFDATDCLTADWFPTYERVSQWDAAAFPMGRTLPVARGCPMRCPTCYGSYAATFGPGYLVRSGPSLAGELKRAEALGLRNLRLVVGKPPAETLSELLSTLASAGPYRFPTTAGFYLCTPPTSADLKVLEAAFANRVVISMVPSQYHVPAVAPALLAEEMAAWRAAAEHVARSRNLGLDVWAMDADGLTGLRRAFGAEGTSKVTVSLGAVWHVTRPTDGARAGLADVLVSMQPVWTIYAARLLSPALARLLAPFRLLDEIDRAPEDLTRPDEPLASYFDRLMQSWRDHHLPMLPDLTFSALPLSLEATHRLVRRAAGVQYRGAMGIAPPGSFALLDAPAVPLVERTDHGAVRLSSSLSFRETGDALGFVPHPVGGAASTPTPEWARSLGAHGLAVVEVPRGMRQSITLQVTLRVQEAEVALLDISGKPVARARADLSYVRPPPRNWCP
jgi:hypothetical protein